MSFSQEFLAYLPTSVLKSSCLLGVLLLVPEREITLLTAVQPQLPAEQPSHITPQWTATSLLQCLQTWPPEVSFWEAGAVTPLCAVFEKPAHGFMLLLGHVAGANLHDATQTQGSVLCHYQLPALHRNMASLSLQCHHAELRLKAAASMAPETSTQHFTGTATAKDKVKLFSWCPPLQTKVFLS